MQQADGRGCLACPGPAFSEPQPQAAATAHEASRDGEDAQAEAFRFPSAGRAGERDHLHPGQQLAGQGHDLAPDLVLREALERQVPQPGVLGAPDPVLAPGPPPVPQFQVGELAALRVGGQAGEPVPVDVGEPQLRAGCGRSFRAMTRILAGQPSRSSRPVMSATQAPSRTSPPPP